MEKNTDYVVEYSYRVGVASPVYCLVAHRDLGLGVAVVTFDFGGGDARVVIVRTGLHACHEANIGESRDGIDVGFAVIRGLACGRVVCLG